MYNDRQNRGHQPPIANDHASGQLVYQDATDVSTVGSDIYASADTIRTGMAEPTVEPETSSASTGAVMTTGILNNNMSDGVRLAGSTEPDRGRIEVLYKEEWGTICDTYLDFNDARVICRMLGYEYAACVMGGSATANEFGSGTGRIWLSQVQCTGYEEDIGLCQHEGWGTRNFELSFLVFDATMYNGHQNRRHQPPITNEYASRQVIYQNATDVSTASSDIYASADTIRTVEITTWKHNEETSDGVRLAGSTRPDRGRIEILYKGEWGTICDTYLDFNDAHVICRMLGYDHATCVMGGSATANEFGSGTGRIWLSQVQCTGYEEDIGLCEHEGWGTVSCGHDTDTSVCCTY
uniref:deleted in malignant brain tumors 1 protein-like n=1 Tax=Styela clava TaxID=7725 RepID=UPI0019395C12|nr:deleted in malignant brain tumors 1 protein-like [Styela clava]